MKSLFFTIAFCLTFQVFASVSGSNPFLEASSQVTSELESLYGQGSIVAYQVEAHDDEVEVEVLATFQADNFVSVYGCHQHGDHFDCHQEAEEQFNGEITSSLAALSHLQTAEMKAFDYVSSRLRPFLTSYKVWAMSSVEEATWVRFNFDINGASQHFFVVCHEVSHDGGQPSFHCHTSRTTSVEPQF